MEDTLSFFIGLIIGLFLCACLIAGCNRTYKDGQVDALTGKVQYHLVTNPDSSKTWENIK